MDLDLWYPATIHQEDTTIAFRQILGLLDQRVNYYTASRASVGLSQQIARLFCDGFNCSNSSQLLNFRTATFNNAIPANGKFQHSYEFSQLIEAGNYKTIIKNNIPDLPWFTIK